jgi:hypothetical protein
VQPPQNARVTEAITPIFPLAVPVAPALDHLPGVIRRDRRERHLGVDHRDDLRRRHDAVHPPVVAVADVHALDEAHDVAAAESIAKDIHAGPDDIRPPLLAASMIAAFTTVRDRLLEAQAGEPISHEQPMGTLDEVLEFTRGGLEALQRE